MPVQRADLRPDAPERHRLEVLAGDARALGEHAHEVVRVVLRDGDAVGWEVREEPGFRDVDEVVVRSVFEHVRIPAVVGGFDRLRVHA